MIPAGMTMKYGIWMIVANNVSPTSGNHGALDRHAINRDLVSSTSRVNRNAQNVINPEHADPIWSCHPGRLFIWNPKDSIKSGNVVSTVMKAHEPANNAIIRVVGV
jgi:hypothetical protein